MLFKASSPQATVAPQPRELASLTSRTHKAWPHYPRASEHLPAGPACVMWHTSQAPPLIYDIPKGARLFFLRKLAPISNKKGRENKDLQALIFCDFRF